MQKNKSEEYKAICLEKRTSIYYRQNIVGLCCIMIFRFCNVM